MFDLLVGTDIRFPNLGITLNNVGKNVSVFGFKIAFYGMIIVTGMILGTVIACMQAKRTGQKVDTYEDFALYAIISAILGARIYYVIFYWQSYADNPISVFDIRSGGLAIYGGVIGGIICALCFCRIKKIKVPLFLDTCSVGLLTGQVIGRWGNFFNREAFGKYTDNLLAMQLDLRDVSYNYRCDLSVLKAEYEGKPEALANIIKIRDNIVTVNGAQYIQVMPTFLYESLWNLILLVVILCYAPHKKFDGEMILMYFGFYGLGRFWIEALRTDQLFLWNTGIAVSQLLSAILAVSSITIIIIMRIKIARKSKSKKV